MNKIIENIDNVWVSNSELVDRTTVNRCLDMLLQNDILLNEAFKTVFGGLDITEWHEETKTTEYSNGQLVWLRYTDEKTGDVDLYLMRKIQKMDETVQDDPIMAIKTGDYEKYGWKDENQILDITKFEIVNKANRIILQRYNDHQLDVKSHPFGMLTSNEQYNEQKILLADMSNIKSSRKKLFFPSTTVKIQSNGTILNGYYRVWDNGIVELDIVYRMGYAGIDKDTGLTRIECNTKEFSLSKNPYNTQHFNSVSDSKIFVYESEDKENDFSYVGDTIQRNRNDYVNVYSADIAFPDMYITINGKQQKIHMANVDYMIFSTDVSSQDADTKRKMTTVGSNSLTYGDRTTDGFTSVLITYPTNLHYVQGDEGYNTKYGGLVSNSFRCRVIGRWEKN